MKSRGLFGSILIAAALAALFILVIPAYDEIRAVQQAINEREAVLGDLEDALSSVKKLKSEMASNSTNVGKAGGIVTGPKNNDEIIVALEAMANESGIQLSSIEMGKGKSEKQYETITVKLSGVGIYSGIQLFLDKIEKNTRLFDVVKLSLAKTGIGLRFNIELGVYYLE